MIMEKQKGAGIKAGSFSLRDSQGPGLLPGGEKGGTDQGKQEERAGKNRKEKREAGAGFRPAEKRRLPAGNRAGEAPPDS